MLRTPTKSPPDRRKAGRRRLGPKTRRSPSTPPGGRAGTCPARHGGYPSRETLAEWADLDGGEAAVLSEAVEELVAIGAAIGSNCEKCFKYHYDQARKAGVTRQEMLRAVELAESVKQSPAEDIRELAGRMLEESEESETSDAESDGCCSKTADEQAEESASSSCCS